jgi:hypothetical protein
MAKTKKCSYSPKLSKLCTPSSLYFFISLVLLLLVGFQNLVGNDDTFCIGQFRCTLGNKLLIFVLNAIYILFWTFILDLMCKAGYKELSWFIVLIPFILFFVFFAMVVYKTDSYQEGMKIKKKDEKKINKVVKKIKKNN